jgi:fructose-1,6-bisphosphatase/inositol monophosphatase family enzyme
MDLKSFEVSLLEDIQNGWLPEKIDTRDDTSIATFGIWSLVKIGTMIRAESAQISDIEIIEKNDGSPVTNLEYSIEEFIKQSIVHYLPDVSFEGEESGGSISEEGVALALDPLDGTRSFLSHAGTSATSMIFYRDGQPVVGMVLNTANGELGYVIQGKNTRLIQMNIFGEQHQVVNLPTSKNVSTENLLVNFHPSRKANHLAKQLYELWQTGDVKLVKSISGSPALALLEAAKGHSVYINLWKGSPALSYDLAAGILLVRGAGGDVINMEGNSIPYIGHHGPFFAGLSLIHLEHLSNNLKNI